MDLNSHAFSGLFNVYSLIILILIIITGCILGYKQKITVFRNYNDLFLTFLLLLLPIVLSYIFLFVGFSDSPVTKYFIIAIELILFIYIVIQTVKDNENLFYSFISLITKIFLSILFVFNLINFITPTGKTAKDRAGSRQIGFIFLLALAPIVFMLVKNKEGIFNPEKTLASRGVRV